MELMEVFLCFMLVCGIKLTWCSNSGPSSQNSGVIPIARCRARCLSRFLDATNDCQRNDKCRLCWSMCESLLNDYEIWKETCSKKTICTSGCQVACKFRNRSPPVRTDISWKFVDSPAVIPDPKIRKAWMAWSSPVPINSIPDSESASKDQLVYVLLTRDMTKTPRGAWQETLQTSSTGATLDLVMLPYHPEFWLLAVSRDGTIATTRFNASVSEEAPYTEDRIEFPGKFESRYGNGAVIELDNDSTLNLTMDLQVRNGYVHPTIMWSNPPVIPRRGRDYLMYRIDYYLQNCRCDLPSDHFSDVETAGIHEKPKFKLKGIAFNAEYLVEVSLISDERKWHGKMTFWTPDCSELQPLDQTHCLEDISNKPKLVTKPSTTTESLSLGNIFLTEAASLSTERPPKKNNETKDFVVILPKSEAYHNRVPLDWNITVIDKQYDPPSHKVFVHLRWQLPFSHVGIKQMLIWYNMDHTEQVDAGRTGHIPKAAESTSEILKLAPNSGYRILVEARYNTSSGVEGVVRSKPVIIHTNSTDEMSEVQASRSNINEHEKDILNGIILGVTVVASIIIFGIIVLFIYKKRHSFRDIIITKTAVAKSNSYKSNVGCKVDYSNQILLTSDDWEVDCRKLKFASHIGQGAFGKVVTGYYDDSKVAIKLIRDCAPISYKEDLLAEINLMKRIGSHPNIVSMIGACTLTEPIALIMEYVPFGNLQNFLKKCRLEGELTQQSGRTTELNYSFMDEHGGLNEGVVTPADMLSFARQVAMAMEYLCDKKYVHRDLAARNVLLGYDKVIKVCDFGLSRDIYNDNQYKKLTNGKLPLKWMAIESLRDRVFTTQSDVWSFGILLWEIVTMGASPYPNIALADLYYVLSNHYRMEKPSNCSDELYVIMRQCWFDDPNDRPSFTDLRVQLELLLTRDRNYLELDNINVPLSTPETSSGSPESDETASLLAAQALQTTRKSSKDELTVNVCIHEKSVDRLLKRKGDLGSHNITIL